MNINTYYKKLDRAGRKMFAARAGTSPEYIEIHLLPRRKLPRKKMMKSLAESTEGQCSYEDVVKYFFLDAA